MLLETYQEVKFEDPPVVPWFPTSMREVGLIGKKIEAAGSFHQDHPFFTDKEYKKRREEIAAIAHAHKFPDEQIPIFEYTQAQTETWNQCLKVFGETNERIACEEYRSGLNDLKKHCGFKKDRIPQLREFSQFIYERTGSQIRPAAGFLPLREFLNGLAFKVFHNTPYVRHPAQPLFTPQPEIIHLLLGHGPMFLNQEYANIAQQIGLASLGASDQVLDKLLALYLHVIQFGVVMERGQPRLFGGDLMSCVTESEKARRSQNLFRPLDSRYIEPISHESSPERSVYYFTESLKQAYNQVNKYSQGVERAFRAFWNEDKEEVGVDKALILERAQ